MFDKNTKARWKVIVSVLGGLVVFMTAIISYRQLGWDEFAFISDVVAVEERVNTKIDDLSVFAAQTRAIVLDQEWWRLQKEVETLEAMTKGSGQEKALRATLISNLKMRQGRIKDQITALEKK